MGKCNSTVILENSLEVSHHLTQRFHIKVCFHSSQGQRTIQRVVHECSYQLCWKNSKVSVAEWIFFRIWYIHTMKYDSTIKKEWIANVCHSMNESQKHFAKERSRTQRQQTTWFHLLEIPRKSKTTETENRPVVFWVRECKWGLTENCRPPQYSCLENSMDRGAWWASVHGVTRVRHDWVTKPTTNSSKRWCEHLPRRASTNTITLRQKAKEKEIRTELTSLKKDCWQH